jgi:hypothetical protein
VTYQDDDMSPFLQLLEYFLDMEIEELVGSGWVFGMMSRFVIVSE